MGALKYVRHDCKFLDKYCCGNDLEPGAESPID